MTPKQIAAVRMEYARRAKEATAAGNPEAARAFTAAAEMLTDAEIEAIKERHAAMEAERAAFLAERRYQPRHACANRHFRNPVHH